MNGIRLVACFLAAILLIQLDSGDLKAQRGDVGNDLRGGPPAVAPPPDIGMGMGASGGKPSRRSSSNRSRSTSRSTPPSSRSSSGSRRRSNSSRSRSSNNAIKTNPLFQFLDQDGDGELSLEEIDAASRMLYSLDENEDDAITADEVEDMMVEGVEDEPEEDRGSSRSSRSSRSSSRGSSRDRAGSSRTGGTPGLDGKAMGGLGGKELAKRRSGSRGSSTQRSADDEDFAANDKNEDGFLTRGEMPRSLRTKFRRMDTNGDGEVDEDEWDDYLQDN